MLLSFGRWSETILVLRIFNEAPSVQVKSNDPDQDANSSSCKMPAPVSRWIQERYPPLHELLCTHDVARLTRRLRWVIAGLCLIGKFSKKLKLKGRAISCRRSDVVAWLAQNFGFTRHHGKAKRSRARRRRRRPGAHDKTSPAIRR